MHCGTSHRLQRSWFCQSTAFKEWVFTKGIHPTKFKAEIENLPHLHVVSYCAAFAGECWHAISAVSRGLRRGGCKCRVGEEMPLHDSNVLAMVYSHDLEALITASQDTTIRVHWHNLRFAQPRSCSALCSSAPALFCLLAGCRLSIIVFACLLV